jgi:hypothetical protein
MYILIFMFYERDREDQKILDRIMADVPRVLFAPNSSTNEILIC